MHLRAGKQLLLSSSLKTRREVPDARIRNQVNSVPGQRVESGQGSPDVVQAIDELKEKILAKNDNVESPRARRPVNRFGNVE